MPTPVSLARQCLAEEAAAALDEAVAVAKRRGHGQTTSLHAVSALLSLPSSAVREACTRARSSACSPRLQFRALELCVGVALDRVSVSKSSSAVDEPPVSNSLMAAIKRSQANQRRHPDTFHLYQRQQFCSDSQNSISAVKVEMHHFVMSILDDPIVNRVFGDAGFRTHEIKWAILNPLPVSRLSSSPAAARCPPPLFMCSLTDLESNKPDRSSFPFTVDENSRRVGEILVKRNRRNPLLIGGCADDALRNFIDCLNRKEPGVFPKEIDGVSVISIREELMEEEMRGLKMKQVGEIVENCERPGVIVNFGDLKYIVDVGSVDVLSRLVTDLKSLLINSGGRLWVIGFLANDDIYKRLLERVPSIEMDWDLNLLPITSPTGGKRFRSSLMGSFVPLGGFFPMPSELETLHTTSTHSSSLCNLCNDKYNTEVSTILKGTSTVSIADVHTVNLPSWLSTADCEASKKSDTVEAKYADTVLDARVGALHRKWSDICHRFHCSSVYQGDSSKAKSQTWGVPSFQNSFTSKDTADVGSFVNGSKPTNSIPDMPSGLQKHFLSKQDIPKPVLLENGENVRAEIPVQGIDNNDLCKPSVTTDLELGTFYDSTEGCRRKTNSMNEASRSHEITSSQAAQSPSCSYNFDKQMYMKDLEYPWKPLAEKIYWQIDAIQSISRTVLRCRSGNGRYSCSKNGNVWLSFLGPDKAGKKKIAGAMAEIVFGRKENILSLDLRSVYMGCPCNAIVDSYDLRHQDLKSGRKMIVDYLAEELSKRPSIVVVLEHIEKADIFVQSSLSQAIKTGKFPNSHGRDININNAIFVLASDFIKVGEDPPFVRIASEYPEAKILEAKNLQMQIVVRTVDENYSNSAENVSVIPNKLVSDKCPVNKRKLIENESGKAEVSKRSRSMIDLNLPVEDTEEYSDTDKREDDDDNQQTPETMLEELLGNVDENVVFKPFDFDALAHKILKEIDVQLKKVVGVKVSLEISREVMLQILAAAWLADMNDALEDWIKNVLCSTIKEAKQRCNVTSRVVMQLLPCDGLVVEEQAYGVCLPSRIIVN